MTNQLDIAPLNNLIQNKIKDKYKHKFDFILQYILHRDLLIELLLNEIFTEPDKEFGRAHVIRAVNNIILSIEINQNDVKKYLLELFNKMIKLHGEIIDDDKFWK